MAFFGPSKEDLVTGASTIVRLEGVKIPRECKEYGLKEEGLGFLKESYTVIRLKEYVGHSFYIYTYKIDTTEAVEHKSLLEHRVRVIDSDRGVVLDSSTSPKDIAIYKWGMWVYRMDSLYSSINQP